jgi:hypothetical protein
MLVLDQVQTVALAGIVLFAGFRRFMRGTTANAMANMEALVQATALPPGRSWWSRGSARSSSTATDALLITAHINLWT